MSNEILISIIGGLQAILLTLVSYVWISSKKENERRMDRIEKAMEDIRSEIRNVFSECASIDKRLLEYQIKAEQTFAHKDELKNGLRLARSCE